MRVATFLSLFAGAAALFQDGSQHAPASNGLWEAGAQTPDNTMLSVVICVKEQLPGLTDLVHTLSDPTSPSYGQWLSLSDVNKRFSDHKARGTVEEFLSKAGVEFEEIAPAFYQARLPAGKANSLLGADFRVHRHKNGQTVHRSKSIRLPASVAWAVDSVEYATRTPVENQAHIFTSRSPTDGGDANPQVIQKYYNIQDPTVSNPDTTNCVFETLGQSIQASDVVTFCSNYNLLPQYFNVTGPNDPSSCSSPQNCEESTLDVQVITSNAQSATGDVITTFWAVPGTESFLQWITAVSADPSPPWVHSISYGENEKSSTRQQDDSFDQALQKIALRGVTVIVSSGDDGVAGAGARQGQQNCGFNPSYPATASYVTAVGATMGPETDADETACTSDRGGGITTGGGFSTIFTQPKWQKDVAQNYLNTAPSLPPTSMFNTTGRGYPDVGLMGHNYPIVIGGQTYHGSGTSASAPLFAAMITLVNDARLNAGSPTLGWLNPALYGLSRSVWHDITVGENNCAAGGGATAPTCCQYGFTEQPGWSPLTGLGSPKFEELLRCLR